VILALQLTLVLSGLLPATAPVDLRAVETSETGAHPSANGCAAARRATCEHDGRIFSADFVLFHDHSLHVSALRMLPKTLAFFHKM
jgi:hypothetical protein